jgi:ribosome maturation factor RimP
MKQTPVKPVTLAPEQIQTIRQTVFQVVETRLESPFYLIDVGLDKELGAWFLRLYIEKPDFSISLQDCERVSRALDEHINGIKVLQGFPYSLEVSSPGLFRALSTEREFAFYKGRHVRVVREELAPPVSKNRRLKPAIIEHELAAGTVEAYDPATRTVTLSQPDQQTQALILEADFRVFLNPDIRFPQEEQAVLEDPDLNPSDLLEDQDHD